MTENDVQEKTDEDVSKVEMAVKKTKVKSQKKTSVKSEAVSPNDSAQTTTLEATISDTAPQADKKARLVNRLKEMGMMSDKKTDQESEAIDGKMTIKARARKLLSPQLVAVAAGACVFSVLIWVLEQERRADLPQAGAIPPAYTPSGVQPYAPYPGMPPAYIEAPAQQYVPYQPSEYEPPVYHAQPAPVPQGRGQYEQQPMGYPQPYGYGYGYGYPPPPIHYDYDARMQNYAPPAYMDPNFRPPVYYYPPGVPVQR